MCAGKVKEKLSVKMKVIMSTCWMNVSRIVHICVTVSSLLLSCDASLTLQHIADKIGGVMIEEMLPAKKKNKSKALWKDTLP